MNIIVLLILMILAAAVLVAIDAVHGVLSKRALRGLVVALAWCLVLSSVSLVALILRWLLLSILF